MLKVHMIFVFLLQNFGFGHAPCEALIVDDSMMDLSLVSPVGKNIFVDDVPIPFRYKCWQLFSMDLGIDLGCILAPMWLQIPCSSVIDLLAILEL